MRYLTGAAFGFALLAIAGCMSDPTDATDDGNPADEEVELSEDELKAGFSWLQSAVPGQGCLFDKPADADATMRPCVATQDAEGWKLTKTHQLASSASGAAKCLSRDKPLGGAVNSVVCGTDPLQSWTSSGVLAVGNIKGRHIISGGACLTARGSGKPPLVQTCVASNAFQLWNFKVPAAPPGPKPPGPKPPAPKPPEKHPPFNTCDYKCPKKYHVSRYLTIPSCGTGHPNARTCEYDEGDSFLVCDGTCPEGYHLVRLTYSGGCSLSGTTSNNASVCNKN